MAMAEGRLVTASDDPRARRRRKRGKRRRRRRKEEESLGVEENKSSRRKRMKIGKLATSSRCGWQVASLLLSVSLFFAFLSFGISSSSLLLKSPEESRSKSSELAPKVGGYFQLQLSAHNMADKNEVKRSETLATAAAQKGQARGLFPSDSEVTGARLFRKKRLASQRAKAAAASQQQQPAKRQVIHAMLKGQVVLSCNLEPSEPDDAVSLVLWYKDKSMVPIYSVDARSAPVQEARHKPGPWLEGRATLKISNQRRNKRQTLNQNYNSSEQMRLPPLEKLDEYNERKWRHRRRRHNSFEQLDKELGEYSALWRASSGGGGAGLGHNAALLGDNKLIANLYIDSLSSEDNGLYLCRVDFRKARSRTQESVLRIIVPAERPVIRDLSRPSDRHAHSQVLGPHSEGTKVVLECETQGGYPEPSLSWWRNGVLVDDSYEIVSAATGLVLDRREGTNSALPESDPPPDGSQQQGASGAGEPQVNADGTTVATSSLTAADDGLETPKAGSEGASLVTQNRLIRNRLELIGLTRAELLANYSCQAWNTKLSEPPTSSVMIDMNLRPIKVQIENERQPVQADKPLDVVCRAFGSRPVALITWWRNGVRLEAPTQRLNGAPILAGSQQQQQVEISESVSGDSNVTSSTLTFVPQIEDGGQIITCKAENPLIEAPSPAAGLTIEDSWKLDVHYLPRVKLTLGEKLSDKAIEENHDVYFECSVRAHPASSEIKWWFEGKELETNVSAGIIISNQSLVLQKVNRNQRGRYTCSAINQVGESHSNSLHLRIQYAPFCRDFQSTKSSTDSSALSKQHRFKTHYGAARLESVRVYCHVDADPAPDPLAYKWAFVAAAPTSNASGSVRAGPEYSGQQLVYLDASLINQTPLESPLISVATYTPRSELDYGTLLCWAQNGLGQQAEPCAYQIVQADRPDPVRNCRLLNATDTQLIVACEPGYDGGIDQRFQMEVYWMESSKRELVANVSSSSISQLNWSAVEQGGALGDQLAGLISMSGGGGESSTASRQQKQRHSSSAAAQQQQPAAAAVSAHETLFITEASLRPGTEYLLSIYSSNQKGSSKPVAFTASTSAGQAASSVRDGRRANAASHLLSDVLALSWNPFLLVCAVTLLLFFLFGSLTFALMKYVDFWGPLSGAGSGGGGGCGANGDNAGNGNGCQDVRPATSRAPNTNEPSDLDPYEPSGYGDDDDDDDDEDCGSSSMTTNTTARSRARVVTETNSKAALSPLDSNRIPLMAVALEEPANLTQIQQLATNGLTRTLKQSNSDNYLDQLMVAPAASARLADQKATRNQHGTLPKNLSILKQRYQPSVQFALESPYFGCPAKQTGEQEPRLEQLVISGKQYQVQRGAGLYRQQQRHLQLTSFPGPAQPDKPYLAAQSAMKDYSGGCGGSANYQPLVCIQQQQQQMVIDGLAKRTAGHLGTTGAEALQRNNSSQLDGVALAPMNPGDAVNDELPIECDNVHFMTNGCPLPAPARHVAHLALVGEAPHLDSDGMSSGTQRSLTTTTTTNGSPASSGIAEQEPNGFVGSSSTITSLADGQYCNEQNCGGNLVSVAEAPATKSILANGSMKANGKKHNFNALNDFHQTDFNTIAKLEQQQQNLDQFTVFVNGLGEQFSDFNNNKAEEFFVIPTNQTKSIEANERQQTTNKARVRIVGGHCALPATYQIQQSDSSLTIIDNMNPDSSQQQLAQTSINDKHNHRHHHHHHHHHHQFNNHHLHTDV